MELLKDYIGIRGIGTTPDSGIYINQLPGIKLQDIQRIADNEQVTFANVWSDIQTRAGMRIARELRTRLKARYKIKSNRGVYNLASIDKGGEVAAEDKYRGVVYESGIDNNGFFAFHIYSITVDLLNINFGALANPVKVKLFDTLGILLDTFTLTAPVAGLNTVKVNKEYNSPKIFIALDTTEYAVKDTLLVDADNSAWQLGITNLYGCGCTPSAYGATSSLASPGITMLTANTSGISAVISPICSYNSLIANNKEELKDAWLYLLGAELMTERMYSPRINKLTTVDGEEAEALMGLFTAKYEDAFEDFLRGMQINAEDGCIECVETISRRETLP